jgi:serine protease Do
MSNIKTRSLILGAGVSLAVLGAAVAWGEDKAGGPVNAAPAVADAGPMGATTSFAPIVQKVSPAVVSIDIVGHASPSEIAEMQQEQGQGQGQGQGQSLPFGFPEMPGMGDQAPPSGKGQPAPNIRASGSGFFISPTGYIVTNNHVVEDAQEIAVHTADGRTLKAHVVGRDPATDIAVVKVDGGNFPYVSFEDSAKPRVGDWVVAMGNPFGLGGTATAGIVSALGREDVADSPLVDYMQIDAPINRGNSGGPTFDVNGRVVGVNTAIYSPSGGSVGIGFDIPAATVSTIARQLIAYGHVDHGYLGATVQEITPDLSQSLGMQTTDGTIVDQLSPDGPAQRAGLQAGDVIVSVNGQTVKSPTQLTRQVAFAHPGDVIRLDVLRNGKPLQITAHAGVRPSAPTLAKLEQPQGGNQGDQGDDDGNPT